MIDANYALNVAQAITLAKAGRDLIIFWFEEPIIPENFVGYVEISIESSIAVAQGENLHTQEEFQMALAQSHLNFIQPYASNCGGITGWLRVSAESARSGVLICSHEMQELHASLVSGQAHGGWLEVHSFPIDRYTKQPLQLE